LPPWRLQELLKVVFYCVYDFCWLSGGLASGAVAHRHEPLRRLFGLEDHFVANLWPVVQHLLQCLDRLLHICAVVFLVNGLDVFGHRLLYFFELL
jgi:hypothetical protein